MNAETVIRRSSALLALGCAAAVLTACRAGGSTSVERANDELRRRNLELEDRVAELEGTSAELAVKLEESERARTSALPREVLEAIPRCVGIEIGGLSGVRSARDTGSAVVIVDVQPSDARGRFVQIVGTLTVEARAIPPAGIATGDQRVLTAVLPPSQVRDAYRGGLLGARYTVELPAEELPGTGDLVIRASFADALTGRVHTAELTRAIRPDDPDHRRPD